MASDIEDFFKIFISHSSFFFWELYIQVGGLFTDWELLGEGVQSLSSLYILNINWSTRSKDFSHIL